jgi:hypothetical protein
MGQLALALGGNVDGEDDSEAEVQVEQKRVESKDADVIMGDVSVAVSKKRKREDEVAEIVCRPRVSVLECNPGWMKLVSAGAAKRPRVELPTVRRLC